VDKYEFGSPQWTDALRGAFERAWSAADPEETTGSFSLSECYIDPPAHLGQPGERLGWHCRFSGDKVTFLLGPSEDVDVYIETDYQAVLPLARLVYGDDPERQRERESLLGALVGEGKLRVKGDLTNRPAFLDGVHDYMATITA
jgi:hypothetical protein